MNTEVFKTSNETVIRRKVAKEILAHLTPDQKQPGEEPTAFVIRVMRNDTLRKAARIASGEKA